MGDFEPEEVRDIIIEKKEEIDDFVMDTEAGDIIERHSRIEESLEDVINKREELTNILYPVIFYICGSRDEKVRLDEDIFICDGTIKNIKKSEEISLNILARGRVRDKLRQLSMDSYQDIMGYILDEISDVEHGIKDLFGGLDPYSSIKMDDNRTMEYYIDDTFFRIRPIYNQGKNGETIFLDTHDSEDMYRVVKYSDDIKSVQEKASVQIDDVYECFDKINNRLSDNFIDEAVSVRI
jgi:hypothetical protein